MSDILYNRTLELLLDAFKTAKTGGLVNLHCRNFYQKIDPLLSAELKTLLQQSPQAPETEAKLRLELDLLFQRQVFSIHAAMFVKDYEDNC